jgi:hypothetical protein
MRFILTFFAIACICSMVNADDAGMQKFAEYRKFSKISSPPTERDLSLGRLWECDKIFGRSNEKSFDFSVESQESFRIEKMSSQNSYRFVGNLGNLEFQSDSKLGIVQTNGMISFVVGRATGDGRLILEGDLQREKTGELAKNLPESLWVDGAAIFAYWLCQ